MKSRSWVGWHLANKSYFGVERDRRRAFTAFEKTGGIMRTFLRTAALVLLVSGAASQASAADKIWSVSGVVNNGLATVFTCTNGGTAAANMKVDVFRKDATFDATGTVSIAPGATKSIGTKTVAALPGGIDLDLGANIIHGGSARITAPSGVFCTALIIDPSGTPPVTFSTLNIFKKTTQKGD